MTVEILLSNEDLKTFQSDTQFETNRMQEFERLASFVDWPEGNTPSPLTLARCGFAYSGESNRVFCTQCQIQLDNLTRDANPAEEHKRRSPGCLLANEVAAVSNSSEPIRSLPETSNSTNSTLWDVYTSASRRYHGQNRQDDVVPSACLSLSVRVDRQNPDYELLRRECIRFDTFYDWPSSAHARPEALAREGFFYTGSSDRVRCAFCHNTLHTWAPGDNPTEEHRKHFPRCPFVMNLDVGNVRIENGVQLENSSQNLLSLTGAVTAGASAGHTSAGLPSLEAFMSTSAVRAALEMGFAEESVKQVVQQHLTETGELFPSAESLVEQLLSSGISQSYIGSGKQTSTASASNATSAASASLNLAFPAFTSSFNAPSSSATVASPSFLGASSSLTTEAFSAASPVPTTQSVASASLGGETVLRTGEERNEETSIPLNEGAKKGNGPTKKRRRGPKKEKMGASVGGSSSSLVGSSELQAVPGETSSGATAAAANSPADENAGLVVDPEEQHLLDENSRLKEARTCKVCMDKEVNTVFLPCGHLICCDNCSPKVRNCPLCRTFIRGTVKTYLS